MRYLRVLMVVLGVLALCSQEGRAAITLHAIDVGWYDDSGFHDSTNKNYIAGVIFNGPGSTNFNDFFAFDLTSVSDNIVGAHLSVFNPAFGYTGTASVYTNYDVSTTISDLVASQTTRTDIYNDLGSGTAFGSLAVSSADDNTHIDVTLNAAAIAALNAARGSDFAIGGSLATIDPTNFIFGGSQDVPPSTNLLVLETSAAPVPEPTTIIIWSLLGSVGISIGWWRRRKAA